MISIQISGGPKNWFGGPACPTCSSGGPTGTAWMELPAVAISSAIVPTKPPTPSILGELLTETKLTDDT